MKRFLILAIPVFLIGLGISFYYAYDPIQAGVRKIVYNVRYNAKLNDGLVGYWSFDGADVTDSLTASSTATDFGSGGNNGQIRLGMKREAGVAGQALEFNGTDEWVFIGTSVVVSETGNFTIAAWIKPDNVSASQKLFTQTQKDNTNQIFSFGINASKLNYHIRDQNDLNEISGSSNTTLSSNTWYHVALTYNTTDKFTFYVNGVADGTDADTTAGSYNTNNVNISGMLRSTPGYDMESLFDGLIDEVRIYNRTLSAGEVSYLFSRNNPEQRSKTTALNQTNAASSLLGHWSFNDQTISGTNAADNGTLANNMTISGASAADGIIGQALLFTDSEDDYLSRASDSDFDLAAGDSLTISAWIKAVASTSPGHTMFIVGRYGAGESTLCGGPNEDQKAWYGLYLVSGAPWWLFRDDNDADEQLVTVTGNYTDNYWHHLVGVVDKSASQGLIYVDGVLRNSAALSSGTGAYTFDDAIYIGGRCGSGAENITNFFNGTIDEVRIYDRALTAAEVKNLYEEKRRKFINMPQNKMVNDGLVGFWTFNGPDVGGTAATDKSGNGNNGTLVGGTSAVEGIIGQALNFDGTNDYVVKTGVSSFTANSVSLWFKPTNEINTGSSGGTLITLKDTDASTYFLIGLGSQTGACANETITVFHNVTDVPFATSNRTCVQNTTFTANQWYHLAISWDTSTSKYLVYVDGVELSTVPADAPFGHAHQLTDATLINIGAFGGDFSAASSFFNGTIDEARIYNRALSAAEIQELYVAARRQ